MADNVPITAGSGTDVATDQVTGTGEHVQLFKLAVSADGSRSLVTADSNGLLVNVSQLPAIPAGSNNIGFVGITDNANNNLVVDTVHNDGESNTENHLDVSAKLMGFNGTTWDRIRGDATNGLQVNVTQIGSALPAGTNMIGKVDLTDGTNDVVIDVTGADAESATTASLVVNARAKMFNGTTWDRVRGTIANGVAVDVTRVQGQVTIGDGTNAVSIDTSGTDAEGNVNQLHVQSRGYVFNGSNWDRQRGFATVNKTAQYTTAQTGAALWTPAAGRAVVVTALQIQAGGTTAGNVQVWFGGAADTTYTRGSDAAVFDGEFAPSATNKPGIFVSLPTPVRGTADFVLRVTSTGPINPLTVSAWGYEV